MKIKNSVFSKSVPIVFAATMSAFLVFSVLSPSVFAQVEAGKATSPVHPPIVPANFKKTAQTATSVTLSWDIQPNLTGYVLEYKKSTDAEWTTWKPAPGVTEANATITNLAANIDSFRLTAMNASGSASSILEPRLLAPGVMKTIRPDIRFEEAFFVRDSKFGNDGRERSFSAKEIVELNALGPNYNWTATLGEGGIKASFPMQKYAKDHPVTCLEFEFKVPRIIEVDLPTRDGKMVKTPVWYVIYNVTNKPWAPEDTRKLAKLQGNLLTDAEFLQLNTEVEFGSTLIVDEFEPGKYNVKASESAIVFVPRFKIESESLPFPKEKKYEAYDQVIPLALPAIIQQEDPNRTFETTVSMADRQIAPDETVWGIAMWKDIDPDIKGFSIYVSGLSNAFRWEVDKEKYNPDVVGSGYLMSQKTLKLNFWAPGAADHLMSKEIQYGTTYTMELIREFGTRLDNDDPYRTRARAIAEQVKQGKPPVDYEWVYK